MVLCQKNQRPAFGIDRSAGSVTGHVALPGVDPKGSVDRWPRTDLQELNAEQKTATYKPIFTTERVAWM